MVRANPSTSKPIVTALLPTCDRPELLRHALDSALSQEMGQIEILIGDDSSSDATAELVETYDDERIRYHRNHPPLGAQQNWLDLARRATTPLVASLHDDDVWHPAFLATLVPRMLADESIAMTFCDFSIIDAAGRPLPEFTEYESKRTRRATLPGRTWQPGIAEGLRLVAVWNAPQPAIAAVLRRDDVVACDVPDEVSPLYDIWFSYQMVKQGRTLAYEPRRLTSYRIHLASATSAGFAAAEDEVFRRIIEEHPDHRDVNDEIRRYWAGLRWARATRLMRSNGSPRDSQRELALAAPDLGGPKGVAAWLASRSRVAWWSLRLAKSRIHDEHGASFAVADSG